MNYFPCVRRIVRAGGGLCESRSLADTEATDSLLEFSHVFLDPNQQMKTQLRTLVEFAGRRVRFLSYKFLFMSIKAGRLSRKVPEFCMREKILSRKSNKRSAESNEQAGEKKKQKPDVITLSDEEEECEIVDEDYQNVTPKVQTKTRTHIPTVVIQDEVQIDVDDEEEDDIEVLEEKLAQTREDDGGSRQYIEREKAKGKSGGTAGVTAVTPHLQEESVEEEQEREPSICSEDNDDVMTEPEEEEEKTLGEEPRGSDQQVTLRTDCEQSLPGETSSQSTLSAPLKEPNLSVSQFVNVNKAIACVEAQTEESGSSGVSPEGASEITHFGEDVDRSSPLLGKILSTVMKRYKTTDEGLAIGNINSRTARFDKHGEVTASRAVGTVRVIDDFNSDDCEDGMDLSSGLLRLSLETCSTLKPSAYQLNVVLSKILLGKADQQIDHKLRVEAKEYLEKFLFLHLTSTKREDWLKLVLSACRSLLDQKSKSEIRNRFKRFDISHTRDLHECWLFFSEAVDLILSDSEGCGLFLSSFVTILHKDFDYWWKHVRGKEEELLPLLFYFLGGSESDIQQKIEKSVLRLYKASLKTSEVSQDTCEARLDNSSRLSSARDLVAMCALLLSHMDDTDGQSFITDSNSKKVGLAGQLAKALASSELSSRGLYIEVSLVQPPWLSALLSQRLLSSLYDLAPGQSLQSSLQSTAVTERQQYLMEVACHKLCAYQQAHNIFRAYWHFLRQPGKAFKTFKHMIKLEEGDPKASNKVIKYEAVAVKVSTVVENVNTIKRLSTDKGEDLTGAISALLFNMKLVDSF